MKLRSECHAKFGSVLDLPLITPVEELADHLGITIRVLDIGAGAHKPYEERVLNSGAAYFSMDTDPEGTFDYGCFADVPPETRFDFILANQVIEHLTVDACREMLSSAFEHTTPGGKIMVTVPNAAHPVRQRDCTHVTPWPANDLYSILSMVGFEVAKLTRYNKFPLTSDPLKRWIVDLVCKEFRMDWCDSIMAVAYRPI
jgi:hypothetical protein